MTMEMDENMVQVIILDISGVYTQIYDQGYFNKTDAEMIKKMYSDAQRWRVVIV